VGKKLKNDIARYSKMTSQVALVLIHPRGGFFFNKIAAKSQCLDLQWQEPNPEPQKPK